MRAPVSWVQHRSTADPNQRCSGLQSLGVELPLLGGVQNLLPGYFLSGLVSGGSAKNCGHVAAHAGSQSRIREVTFQDASSRALPDKRAWRGFGNPLGKPGAFASLCSRSPPQSCTQEHRVERRRDWFRPMASAVSALSSIVANGHHIRPRFLRLLLSCRTASFPPSGWKPVSSLRALPPPSRLGLTQSLPSFRAWLWVQASRFAALPTGPWLSTVYHPRTCNRYYGLIRQSDELRSVWASSAYSGRVFAVAGRPPHSLKPVNWTLLF